MASLPSWERGLKLTTLNYDDIYIIVAPLVGAWIEILLNYIIDIDILRRSPRGSVD